MSRTKKLIQKRVLDNLPEPVVGTLGKIILKAVDKAVADRWDNALAYAAEAEGDTTRQRVDDLIARFRRELTAVGAATGAVAAAPGLGTVAAGTALAADLGWFGMRATDLIMAIGAAHGHTEATMEERRAWVLAVLAFGEEAADEFLGLLQGANPATAALTSEQLKAKMATTVGGDAITLDAIRKINASMATRVIEKYGARRSALAVGKILPFGVGAAIGGAANYAFVRTVGKQARRFFASDVAVGPGLRLVRPGAGPVIDTDVVEG